MRTFLYLVFVLASIILLRETHAAGFAISGVSVVDDQTVALDFSESLSNDPIKVRITRTSNASSVTVSAIRVDQNNNRRALISLTDRLDPNSSYSLIVLAAKSTNGKTITDGIDSITEFATTANLVKSTPSTLAVNPPPVNTGAQMVQNTPPVTPVISGTGLKENDISLTGSETQSGHYNNEEVSDGTKALPETGPNSIIFIVISLLAVGGILGFRSRRA